MLVLRDPKLADRGWWAPTCSRLAIFRDDLILNCESATLRKAYRSSARRRGTKSQNTFFHWTLQKPAACYSHLLVTALIAELRCRFRATGQRPGMHIRGFPLSTTACSNPLIRSKNALDSWMNGLLFVELTCRLIRTNGGDSKDPHLATAIRTLLWSALVVKLAWRLLCQHPAMWWILDFFPPGNAWLDRFWTRILLGTERCIHHVAMVGEWLAPCRDLVGTVACSCVTQLWTTLTTWLQEGRELEQLHNEEDDDVDELMEVPWSREQNWTDYSRDWCLTRSKAPQDKHV